MEKTSILLHNATVIMQSAWIAWQHGEGSEEAMTWISNYLWQRGLLPDSKMSKHHKKAGDFCNEQSVEIKTALQNANNGDY